MLKFLKYLPLAIMGKNVAESYEQETGEGRPWYLSRRFIGSCVAALAGFLTIHLGIKLDADFITSFADNVEKLASAFVALYGAGLAIFGHIERAKEEEKHG